MIHFFYNKAWLRLFVRIRNSFLSVRLKRWALIDLWGLDKRSPLQGFGFSSLFFLPKVCSSGAYAFLGFGRRLFLCCLSCQLVYQIRFDIGGKVPSGQPFGNKPFIVISSIFSVLWFVFSRTNWKYGCLITNLSYSSLLLQEICTSFTRHCNRCPNFFSGHWRQHGNLLKNLARDGDCFDAIITV